MKNGTVRQACRANLLVLIFLSLAGPYPLYSRTIYLAPDGDDNVPVEHGATFRTLAGVIRHLWGGDTLIIKRGTYQGGVFIRRGCKPEAPLVIKAEGPYAVIKGSGNQRDAVSLNDCYNVILDGLNVTGAKRAGILLGHSKFITVRNCTSFSNGKWGIFTDHASDFILESNECYGSADEHGIYHSNSGDNFVIRNNILHHNYGCGIHVNGDPEYGGDGVISYGIIEGNICYKNGRPKGGAGINMTHVQDVIVRNNLLYHNYAGGITFYQDTGTFEQGSKRALITGNTVVYSPGEGRSGVNIMTTSEKVLICGNIFVSGGSRGTIEVNSDHRESIVSDRNIHWGVDPDKIVELKGETVSLKSWQSLTGNDLHSAVADPLFIDPVRGNFQHAGSSKAVDSGLEMKEIRKILERLGGFDWVLSRLDDLPDEDILGRRRPAGRGPDAGAYER